MNNYKISMWSAGDISAASSRLRCFFLGLELEVLGAEVSFNKKCEDVHVLYVQKRINIDILEYAVYVKHNGGIIIYDIDDYGEGLLWLNTDKFVEENFLKLCDVLIVDTDVRLNIFSNDDKYAHIKIKMVLPDPVDYISLCIPEKKHLIFPLELRGAWFGNAINFNSSLPFIKELIDKQAVIKFDAITGSGHLKNLSQNYSSINYIPWDLFSFADLIQQYHFVVLVHNNDIEGMQKSNNKMLASLALGVLPFVSNTSAYANTAVEIGMPELIVYSPVDLVNKLKNLRLIINLYAKLNEDKCQNFIKKFLAKNIAKKFDMFLTQILSVRNNINIV